MIAYIEVQSKSIEWYSSLVSQLVCAKDFHAPVLFEIV